MIFVIYFQPKMVTIDPNDDNIILGIPEDIDPATLPQEGPIKKVKIIQKHVKQSRMMLNRSGKFEISVKTCCQNIILKTSHISELGGQFYCPPSS